MLTTLLAWGKGNQLNSDFVHLQNKGMSEREYWSTGEFLFNNIFTLSNKINSYRAIKIPQKESYREILSSSSHTHNQERQTQHRVLFKSLIRTIKNNFKNFKKEHLNIKLYTHIYK